VHWSDGDVWERVQGPCFWIDNRVLQSTEAFLSRRGCKRLDDKVGAGPAWGEIVQGTDEGDGWLRVGSCFIPLIVEGMPVVTPVVLDGCLDVSGEYISSDSTNISLTQITRSGWSSQGWAFTVSGPAGLPVATIAETGVEGKISGTSGSYFIKWSDGQTYTQAPRRFPRKQDATPEVQAEEIGLECWLGKTPVLRSSTSGKMPVLRSPTRKAAEDSEALIHL